MLRLLQNGEIEKLGSTSVVTVNVRVVAATHRNLQAMVEDDTFREDLYYRLAVVPLELPPLRERREDSPELVRQLFARLVARHGIQGVWLSAGIKNGLTHYRWPGNIRELENVIERMVVLSSGGQLTEADLPGEMRAAVNAVPTSRAFHMELPDEGISLEGVERELLLRALERFHGNQTQAARYLDVSRRTLIYRMEKYGLRGEAEV